MKDFMRTAGEVTVLIMSLTKNAFKKITNTFEIVLINQPYWLKDGHNAVN